MSAQEKAFVKLYPKMSADANGLKYYFDSNGMHYTIRFAGKPVLLLEYIYIQRGGTNFTEEYRLAKEGKQGTQHELLKKCTAEVSAFLDMLKMMNDDGLSPFVIYANQFNPFK